MKGIYYIIIIYSIQFMKGIYAVIMVTADYNCTVLIDFTYSRYGSFTKPVPPVLSGSTISFSSSNTKLSL